MDQVSHQVGREGVLRDLRAEPSSIAVPLPAADGAHSDLPRGDGRFSGEVAGVRSQPELDLQFALMCNDGYHPFTSEGRTGSGAEAELEAAGWHRLSPADGDRHLVDRSGHRIPIQPQMLHDPASGFDAAIYQDRQGRYVIAFRGTDDPRFEAGGDLLSGVGQALGLSTEQYSRAIELAVSANEAFGAGNVVFTGDSLGGGLASAAALATGAAGVTFNAAGLSDGMILRLGLAPEQARAELADSGRIRRYVVDGDVLTMAQQDIPMLSALLPDAVGHELRIPRPPGVETPVQAHIAFLEAMRENALSRPSSAQRADAVARPVDDALATVSNGIDWIGKSFDPFKWIQI